MDSLQYFLRSKLPYASTDRPRLANSSSVEIYVVKALKCVNGLDRVVHIESAGCM
eukprot:COSAG01_NODE_47239_length_392_cov_1.034130_1_plen_54_part_01